MPGAGVFIGCIFGFGIVDGGFVSFDFCCVFLHGAWIEEYGIPCNNLVLELLEFAYYKINDKRFLGCELASFVLGWSGMSCACHAERFDTFNGGHWEHSSIMQVVEYARSLLELRKYIFP
jgi:hypothetical protein